MLSLSFTCMFFSLSNCLSAFIASELLHYSLEMGCTHTLIFSLLFLLITTSTHLRFKVEGRARPNSAELSKTVNDEDKAIMRAQIGSRPPRCERRCSKCEHCEAIQVPTNPQLNHGSRNYSRVPSIAYARGDDSSNYKPMSWKCKCGNLIFNP